MKIWVDDLREPPDNTWLWCKTSDEAMVFLVLSARSSWCGTCRVDEISLDHDLGGDDTTRPLVLFMAESGAWPEKVHVHSANPVGREWLEGMIETYKP